MRIFTSLITLTFLVFLFSQSNIVAQDYVGSERCMMCHNSVNSKLGYNIWDEYNKSGHPYKLNKVEGAAPTFPANTTDGVPAPPPGTTWDDFSYMIGGYGWKARFVQPNGRVFTTTEEAQYNLETQGWVAYHYEEDKKYNYDCFKCHTTGAIPEGSWTGIAEDSMGTFSEPGIRCEGCHGPGGDHVTSPGSNPLPNQEADLTYGSCASCHQRGGTTNPPPASSGYIKHHEQANEMNASSHKDRLTCGTCHDAHIALRYPHAAGEGLTAITTNCQDCHTQKKVTINGQDKGIDCIDCHMSAASKSAVGMQTGNGWRGDVKTHIFHINTAAVDKSAMFNEEGNAVLVDENGKAGVTLDFACLGCHTNQTLEWASEYAMGIHDKDISTDIADNSMLSMNLAQNYPNPFRGNTTIEFTLNKTSNVYLEIYSQSGTKVESLLDGVMMPSGNHEINFSAEFLSNGVYLYRLRADDYTASNRMVVLK